MIKLEFNLRVFDFKGFVFIIVIIGLENNNEFKR